jgi:hypothetical protein
MKNKFVLRLFFLYFFIQAVPLDPKYYQQLFADHWWNFSYGAIFDIAHYIPRFSSGPPSFGDWGIVLLIAVIGAFIWIFQLWRNAVKNNNRLVFDSRDESLYYWIRTIVRYRLAIGILAYGFIKLFPMQAPYPSLSNLNTHYGDFTRWKLFSLSLGIVPSYESFLGLVEIVAGLLLFYRRSASVGALILAIFLGNVFMSNVAYGGGDTVYSLYLVTLALFVLSYDFIRLSNLLFWQKPASANRFRPAFAAPWQRRGRILLKVFVLFFFVLLYGARTRNGYLSEPYQFPLAGGLDGVHGIYNVSLFRKGKDTLAYSKTDTGRWQDIVFEKWTTLSIRSNHPVVLDSVNVERPVLGDDKRDYEVQGAADRSYYRYEADTVNRRLTLYNKNPYYKNEQLVFQYERPTPSRIILSGIDQNHDSVYAVLDRINKKYLIEEAAKTGRQKGLKL